MSERVADERREARPWEEGRSSADEAPALRIEGASLRIDGPETTSLAPRVDAPVRPVAADPLLEKAKVIQEAGQFFLQFQQQLDDVARREEQLAQRLAEFEQAERRFRLWAGETEAELNDRKAAIHAHESALAQRLAEFDRRQRDFDAALDRLEADRQALERERSALRGEMQRELDEARETLAAERQALDAQRAKVEELGDALIERFRTQQAEMERQLQQERERLWTSLSTEWEEQRRRFEQEKADFLKDRTLLENRLRFQQDHLEKTRADLERDQQLAAQRRQAVRQQLEEAERQLLRRKTQLDRYRAALDELDRSLERERDLHARQRAAMTSLVEQERQQFDAERQAWEDERRQQQAELRRQQELLLSHAENLETRRLRLEALRREIEETHHATMELRLAVEEVWAHLQQSMGLTETRRQVEQARSAIRRDYEQIEARLLEGRRELHDAEQRLEQQRLEFQHERRTLTEWIAARDQELLRRERAQQRQEQEQSTRDRAFHELRDRWLREKAEAENVIRRLLNDLIDRTAELPEPEATRIGGIAAA
jgi:chromosome segregation ATPase